MSLYTVEMEGPKTPITRGSVGRDVRRLQEWLGLRGSSVVIDGDWGPATQWALSHILPGENTIDARNWPKLDEPLVRAMKAMPEPGTSLGNLIVKNARASLSANAREVGGDNKGPWVRTYCRGLEVAWCQGFASTMWELAGDALGKKLPMDLWLEGIWCLFVPRMVQEAKAKGLFKAGAVAVPTPGSMFFLRGGQYGWSHVGIVAINNGNGTMTTIEGNTNDDGSPNGYEVAKRTRSIKSCDFAVL